MGLSQTKKHSLKIFKMLRADAASCNSFVSVAIQLIILVLTKIYLMSQINRKETFMKQVKRNDSTINKSIISVLETLWSIGTSITASAVLLS